MTVTLETPAHAGARDQAQSLVATLPPHLGGSEIVLDCSVLVVGTPSFLDEVVKQLIVERNVDRVQVLHATTRVR